MTLRRRSRISDGSCHNCRKRRLRCDLVRPVCNRCSKESQSCIYGPVVELKWVGGIASRGRLAIQNTNVTSAISSPPPTYGLADSDLILYFDNVVLPRFQLDEKLVELDLESVLQDEPLQQAILAVSRAHYKLNSKSNQTQLTFIPDHARQSAIETFRQLLNNGITSENAAQQLFTVNVLLCMLDGMIEPSVDAHASICHLKGGYAILNNWDDAIAQILLQDGLLTHLLSVFATMDLVHALLSGDKPFFESVLWQMLGDTQTWFGKLMVDDPFLILLKTLSEMATLGNMVHSHLPAIKHLSLVGKCLPMVERNLADSCNIFSQPTSGWRSFCETWKCCGMIYTQRALRLQSINSEAVQSATRQGVELLMNDSLCGMMSHCLIFPILVIGAHCLHNQDRRVVLEVLSNSSSYLSFGNLRIMEDFLKGLWNVDDMQADWWSCFTDISSRAFFF